MKRISSILLIITLLVLAIAMTSCDGNTNIVEDLLTDVPEGENAFGDMMHWVGDHLNTMFKDFLSFNWVNSAIEWCDNTFEITKSINLLGQAFELIQEGNPANILEAVGIVFGRISLLFFAFVAGVLVLALTLAVEILADVLIGVIGLVLLIVIILFVAAYFVYQFVA